MRNAAFGFLVALALLAGSLVSGNHNEAAAAPPDPQSGVWIFTLFRDPDGSVLLELRLPCAALPRHIDRIVERFHARSHVLTIDVDASGCPQR